MRNMEAAQSTLNDEPQAVVVRREQERELVSWTAPARPFKRRDRQFFVTTFAMAGIVGLILFFAEGIMPVLSTVEPEKVEYRVTNKGVKIAGKGTGWQLLNKFWFGKRFDSEVMIFDTVIIPGRIEFVITPEVKDRLKKEVSAYIPYEEVPASNLDKLTGWFAGKLPGNG